MQPEKSVRQVVGSGGTSRRLSTVAAETIRQRILSGEYHPTGRLPSEAQLAAELEVSRATLREALRLLEDDGLILSRRGAGSFVRPESTQIMEGLEKLGSLTKSIRRAGFHAEDRVLSIRPVAVSEQMARALQVQPGSPAHMIESLRLADDQPVIYTCDILPASRFKNADMLEKRRNYESLLEFLWDNAGIQIGYCVARVKVVLAAPPISHLVSVETGTPLLMMEGVSHDTADVPVYASTYYFRSDIYDFVLVRRP
ncbi:MAG: GntR family transcriptional regulator [Firmicutes bacterium]|nr:GntR family transcriptional regulator [Bacillota bacterium]